MTTDKIMFYASASCGMLEPSDERTLRLCAHLVAAGHLRREERRVTVPAMAVDKTHALSLGINPYEHEAVIVRYYAVK